MMIFLTAGNAIECINHDCPLRDAEIEIVRRVDEQLSAHAEVSRDSLLKDIALESALRENAQLKLVLKSFEEAAGFSLYGSAERAARYGAALRTMSLSGFEGWLDMLEKAVSITHESIVQLRTALQEHNGKDAGGISA